ncbi:hypothetical protein OBBRIDRAFT_799533 [Obba rivulosa]|uniref:Uncharacterized protein n=1 Tax=Obba rivulosa TaxID=1052685 RepID=A0A8E2AL01_9APHY|nr:hypothetical protein OBBRIDRAFT_799533 [Obba rivulosa]
MDNPHVPRDRITNLSGLSVMPLLPLFMLKLQAWEYHRNHRNRHIEDSKEPRDAVDILELLKIASRKGIKCGGASNSWIPPILVQETKRRIGVWIDCQGPMDNDDWKAVGFDPPLPRDKFMMDPRTQDFFRSITISFGR